MCLEVRIRAVLLCKLHVLTVLIMSKAALHNVPNVEASYSWYTTARHAEHVCICCCVRNTETAIGLPSMSVCAFVY